MRRLSLSLAPGIVTGRPRPAGLGELRRRVLRRWSSRARPPEQRGRKEQRYSLDVNADSSYDAAHLYLTHVRGNPACGFPIPTTSSLFEVATGGRIHHVEGARLKEWIENRLQDWKGPRGMFFQQRPMIGD